jgi:hypothetical protein
MPSYGCSSMAVNLSLFGPADPLPASTGPLSLLEFVMAYQAPDDSIGLLWIRMTVLRQ